METQYDFDDIVNRRNTNCGRWDTMDKKYGTRDMIHLGVADMDFRAPVEIRDSLHKILDMGVLGYTDLSDKFFLSIQRWYKKQYNMDIPREWIVFCPRINIASSICVETYTEKGDGIIMHTPAYGPLQNSILKNNRKMLSSPLKKNGEHYEMDFAQMESMVDEHTKMMILCNPHNPTGRAWTKEELVQVADFCREHDLILFTDEIHGDLMKAGVRHQTALDVTEEMNDRLILASSPTKTFNIPGVIVSYMIIPNEKLRKEIEVTIDRIGMHNPTIFAVTAVEKAYTECDDWLRGLKDYLEESRTILAHAVPQLSPRAVLSPIEATCLCWLDLRAYAPTCEELQRRVKKHHLVLNDGTFFDETLGQGFLRLNFACPHGCWKVSSAWPKP